MALAHLRILRGVVPALQACNLGFIISSANSDEGPHDSKNHSNGSRWQKNVGLPIRPAVNLHRPACLRPRRRGVKVCLTDLSFKNDPRLG